jgi:hypothetical protein
MGTGNPRREGGDNEEEGDAEMRTEKGDTTTRRETTRHEQSRLALLLSFLFIFKLLYVYRHTPKEG